MSTVAEKILNGEYVSEIHVPLPDDVWCSTCEKGLYGFGENVKYCHRCGALYDTCSPTDSCKRLESEHEKDQNRLFLKFKKDAFEELGISDHPKKDSIYQFAFEEYMPRSPYDLDAIFREMKTIVKFLKLHYKEN